MIIEFNICLFHVYQYICVYIYILRMYIIVYIYICRDYPFNNTIHHVHVSILRAIFRIASGWSGVGSSRVQWGSACHGTIFDVFFFQWDKNGKPTDFDTFLLDISMDISMSHDFCLDVCLAPKIWGVSEII